MQGSAAAEQLEALFHDTEFPKFVRHAAAEVMRVWNLPRGTAAGVVMSAVGDPTTLACVHRSWFSPRAEGNGMGLAKLIVRRRVFDLLRSDARRPRHDSLPLGADEVDGAVSARAAGTQQDPCAQVELNQVVGLVRTALRCFASQGPIQERQAELVQRYALDEVSCSALADELGCTRNALGVRVHKAMQALRRHIETHHPELKGLLGRESAELGARDAGHHAMTLGR